MNLHLDSASCFITESAAFRLVLAVAVIKLELISCKSFRGKVVFFTIRIVRGLLFGLLFLELHKRFIYLFDVFLQIDN